MTINARYIIALFGMLLMHSSCFAVAHEVEYYLFQDDVIEIELPRSVKLVDKKERNAKGTAGKTYLLQSEVNKASKIAFNISYTPQQRVRRQSIADENNKLGAILYKIKNHYIKNADPRYTLYHQDEGRKIFGGKQFMTYSAYTRSNTSNEEVITQYLLLSHHKRLFVIVGSAFGQNHTIALQNMSLINTSFSTLAFRETDKEKKKSK